MLDRLVVGEVATKHHITLHGPDGALRYEECLTRKGFDGPYSILYHERRPHLAQVEAGHRHGWPMPVSADVARPLARRHYQAQNVNRAKWLPSSNAGPVDARFPLIFNEDVVVATVVPNGPDPVYVTNADSDEILFIHEGGGVLRTMFGDLRFNALDYVCVPRGVLHRFIPDADTRQTWLSMQCLGGAGLIDKWRNDVGQLRMDAPYSHRDFRRPEFVGPMDEGIRELVVLREGRWHTFRYADSPLDVVGWDGTVYPWAFPILNFQPRAGLVHLPPDWHGTFAARGALICSFVPRVVDFHPDAIPCPYPHSSVDCDEFLYYVQGNFTSRRGVGSGSISVHPYGIPHGPHPGSYERSIGTTRTDELAVMVDTFRPMHATPYALGVEDPGYHDSFLT
jgi:homogentisate 1,2-dioxygenase